ncbi:MAG TPA: VOC family protein [Flavobacteriales bacterium]|nr:VOC family protein [Flavobacteriales bacterium]
MQLVSYLTFNGNCRQAMQFYHKCLGGKLELQTVGESPMAEKLPAKMKKAILHASLRNKNLVLMGSDMVSEQGLIKGNSVSLMLDVKSEKEVRTLFSKLSRGGKPGYAIEKTFFGALLGNFTDKFDNNWILYCKKR